MAKRRRQRGEGSIHERPNGSWCGQITLPYGPAGRRRKTVYGRTQQEVVRKLEAARRDLHNRGDLPTADMTVGKWLAYWLSDIAADRVKPSTFRSYRTAVTEHLTPTIGNVRLGRLSAQQIAGMHKALIARGLSSTTAGNAHRVLCAALNDAVRYGRVGRNVAKDAKPPRPAVSKRTGLTAEEALAVIEGAPNNDLRSRWLTAFLLGVRQGERLGLRWDYVDPDGGTIDFAWALHRVTWTHNCPDPDHSPRVCPHRRLAIPGGMEFEQLHGGLVLMRPKTFGSIRRLPLPPILTSVLRQRQEQNLYSPHGLVWCNDDGSPVDLRRDYQAWKEALESVGVRHVTGHETRHTTATLLDAMGIDPEVIRQILGHSSVMMQRVYRHADLTRATAALAGLEQRLGLPSV